jgi:hypothetical protein
MPVEVYQDPRFAAMFSPVPGGLTVKLDEEATNNILLNYRGPKSRLPKMYILLTPEGNLDRNWPHEHEWERVVRRVTEAPLIVYNASTKKSSRAVWYAALGDRTLANVTWEPVKLIPVSRCMDKSGLPAHAVVFATKGELS